MGLLIIRLFSTLYGLVGPRKQGARLPEGPRPHGHDGRRDERAGRQARYQGIHWDGVAGHILRRGGQLLAGLGPREKRAGTDMSRREGTLALREHLARECGQDTWVDYMDTGYSGPGVVDRVEAGGAVPFVDINPKNSERLQALKEAARAITDLSKKAVKEGLEPDERKAWLGEARAISEEKGERVPAEEKKTIRSNSTLPAKIKNNTTRRRVVRFFSV